MSRKSLMNIRKLTDLFTLFVLGSVCLVINVLLTLPEGLWFNGIKLGLILVTSLSYEIVILSLGSYQLIKAKNKIVRKFVEDREKYFIFMVIILALTYLIMVWFNTESLAGFSSNVVLVILAVIAVPQVNKRLTQFWSRIGSKKVKNNA